MKLKLFSFSLLLIIISLSISAQEQKKSGESQRMGDANKSALITTPCMGELNTPTADLKWRPILTKKIVAFEPKVPDEELIEKIKSEKLLLKQQHAKTANNTEELSAQPVVPLVGTNYLGNENNGTSPMDNQIAVSNGGIIVSVANNTIEYDNTSGVTTYYNDLITFINDPAITSVCDPFILYDAQADRFIFFCQTSPITSNSKIMVFFSKSNNPADGWWTYKLTGNPLNNGEGFDYPKLAVSDNELFITGNLFFDPPLTFDQAILYQIPKAYSGGSINWQYWYGLNGAPFTLLPVGNGQGISSAPGCYMVATVASGASAIKLYHLTGDISSNPSITYSSVPTTAYSVAGNASQLGTSCLLDNGDCRALSGFYLNGVIHFVFHSDIGNGWNGINYNRLTISSLTNLSRTFGYSGSYDCSYPSVVSYGTSPTDKSVMIGFGRTSSAIYPEVRVVNCDDAQNFSVSTLVKESSGFVSYTSTTTERWGDYTGTARKHNSTTPSIWMNGMFGTSANVWNTWISEIHSEPIGIKEIQKEDHLKLFPNPVIETCNVEFTLSETMNLVIEICDISGKKVKEIYNGKGVQGENVFSFNKSNLSAGTYFLSVKNNSTLIKNEKIIIAD
jgi:hypothetical protein